MDADDWDGLDWQRLAELRDGFLAGGARAAYWRDRADVELYDRTFGRRVAWKWRAVLAEPAMRTFPRPLGTLVDWGAGSAIAAREYLAQRGAEGIERVVLVERSAAAREAALGRLRAEHPGLALEAAADARGLAPALVLVSHVVNELDPTDQGELTEFLGRADALIWVEPGSRSESRTLSGIRDELVDRFDVVAPCTHRERCGALANDRDWCHFFAQPAPEVFTERGWALFSRRLGIDLRSLTYSYLAMVQSSSRRTEASGAPLRMLGRARVAKATLRVTACGPEGLRELEIRKRNSPELFRSLARGHKHAPRLWIDSEGRATLDEADGTR